MKRIGAIGFLSLLLAGCGGSDGFDSGSSTSNTDSGGSTTTATGISIGSGTGSSFVEGVLNIAATSQLSAGGSTSVTANLVTSTGAPYTDAVDVTFTSDCVAQGLATLTSPVAASNGNATSTYTAIGCSGTDTITATATVGESLLAASGTVSVAAADLGSVQFVSASPTVISLKGTGGAGLQETSQVTFKVVNETGGPVPDADVTFSLSTDVGGIVLTPTSGKTGTDGRIATIVQAGTVAVPVRVIATATVTGQSTTVFTQSDQLTITTGIPVDGGLSLSLETYNPEAWDYDGVDVVAHANVMDRFHNPVPDGTAVNFRTEAGRIVGSCTTTNGACSATWTSQSQTIATGGDATGVSTIMAYAIGEEKFSDDNGNGRYDNANTAGPVGNTFVDDASYTDLGESFVDYDWDSTRDNGEPFIDFNGDQNFDSAGDSLYNGVLCEHTANCSDTTSVIVSDSIRMVLSTSASVITFSQASLDVRGAAPGGPTEVIVTVKDTHGNIMPAGTTITVTAADGVEVIGSTSYTVPNSAGVQTGTDFTIGFTDADTAVNGVGYIEVKTTTPAGHETTDTIAITF